MSPQTTPTLNPIPQDNSPDRPRIGMLWGDFPWDAPASKMGKLFSMGAVARNMTRALNRLGCVVPYQPPANHSSSEQKKALSAFLQSIDILWADLYPHSTLALQLRQELGLNCPALLFAGGVMPKGAEAMLFAWQQLLTPHDHLIFSCQADQVIWQRLVAWNKLHEWVVPLGVDETIFQPRTAEECTATRMQHGLPQDAPLLVYVGRLNIQKNLHSLLYLLATVRMEVPDVHLCLVGESDDIALGEFGVPNTGYVEWLKTLATELGIDDALTFAGVQTGEALAKLYAAADLCVNLSVYHRENFGMAQAEAQACGTPVVCTNWGGFKDVVQQGQTGYLVDAVMTQHGIRVDWATGSAHVITLLQDKALRGQMATRAHAWADAQFSGTASVAALKPIITQAQHDSARTAAPEQVYLPNRFAERYEAHKRTCGWYDETSSTVVMPNTNADTRIVRYPAMFQGIDYELYVELMSPYATYEATAISPENLQSDWHPYATPYLQLNPLRQSVDDADPLWPHRLYLGGLAWEILQFANGKHTVGQIEDVMSHQHRCPPQTIHKLLWQLHIEGIILFRKVGLP